MIVVMRDDCTEKQIEAIKRRVERENLEAHISKGMERTVIGVIGNPQPELKDILEFMRGVAEVVRVSRPFKLPSREFHPDNTVINVRGCKSVGMIWW